MKKLSLMSFILLFINNFLFIISNNVERDISKFQLTDDSIFYVDTAYTHTWTKNYATHVNYYNTVVDSSNTYFAGKWSARASNWDDFTRKYNYFKFTNNSFFSCEYNNHRYELSTNRNNFWKKTNKIKKYVSGLNNNIMFQISAGIETSTEVILTLEMWYTDNGDISFKWNFSLSGRNLTSNISIHLPQIKYYRQN